MPPPSLVLFDLDGVLVDYDRTLRVQRLAEHAGCTPAQLQAALFESGLESRYDAGELEEAAYLGELGTALGCTFTREVWTSARRAAMRLPADAVMLVEALARRCAVAVLTNNGLLVRDVMPQLLPQLARLFEGRLLCSAEWRLSKPDPRIFLAAVERLGHAPEETLFLDDSAANVEGARRAGLMAEQVRAPGGFAAVLRDHGLM